MSTDEVFGDLAFDGSLFVEGSPYAPSSPYAASKAAADHLVRDWHATYDLSVVLSNRSNNYGPFQFPEKPVPLAILNTLQEMSLSVYGAGANVRGWLFVEDLARALELVAMRGRPGRATMSAAIRSVRTFRWLRPSAICSTTAGRVPPP